MSDCKRLTILLLLIFSFMSAKRKKFLSPTFELNIFWARNSFTTRRSRKYSIDNMYSEEANKSIQRFWKCSGNGTICVPWRFFNKYDENKIEKKTYTSQEEDLIIFLLLYYFFLAFDVYGAACTGLRNCIFMYSYTGKTDKNFHSHKYTWFVCSFPTNLNIIICILLGKRTCVHMAVQFLVGISSLC